MVAHRLSLFLACGGFFWLLCGSPSMAEAQTARVLIQVVSKHTMEPLPAKVIYRTRSNRQRVVEILGDSTDGTFETKLAIGETYIIEADYEGFRKATAEINLQQVTRGGAYDVNLLLTRNKDYPDGSSFDAVPTLLTTLYYRGAEVELDDEALQELARVYRVLKRNPETQFLIVGHTDLPGTIQDNVRVSRLRAQQVKAILISKGISAFRLSTFGMGNTKPTTPFEDERYLNNRVEFHLMP